MNKKFLVFILFICFLLARENKNNLDNIKSCLDFKKNCEKSRDKIIAKLAKFKKEGKQICGYAATSKSTTILNYCESIIFPQVCQNTTSKSSNVKRAMPSPLKHSLEMKFGKHISN